MANRQHAPGQGWWQGLEQGCRYGCRFSLQGQLGPAERRDRRSDAREGRHRAVIACPRYLNGAQGSRPTLPKVPIRTVADFGPSIAAACAQVVPKRLELADPYRHGGAAVLRATCVIPSPSVSVTAALLLASYLSARRAVHVDPMNALRAE